MNILDYEEAILKIKNLEKMGLKPGLQRIKKLLDLMGNPQKNMNFIHIAGTNGKGSVCYMMSSILQESGYHTGLFISPSVDDFRERIQINGEMISKNSLCEILNSIENYLTDSYFINDPITEFEITTAIAFEHFRKEKCDIVVLETGMGGRLDATNVIDKPLCSVITTISIEHKKFLGNTVLEIAKEKLGIVKKNSNLVIGSNLPKEVYELAKNTAKKLENKFIISDRNIIKNFNFSDLKKSRFNYKDVDIEVPLIGEHQHQNIATVLEVINSLEDRLDISIDNISRGLKNVNIPYRLEIVKEKPIIILDACHNVEGAKALSDFIDKNLKNKRIIGIVGVLSDKDANGIFNEVSRFFGEIILVESNSHRAMSINDMKIILDNYNKNNHSFESIESAIDYAICNVSKDDVIIIFGSFTLMYKAKKYTKILDKYDNTQKQTIEHFRKII